MVATTKTEGLLPLRAILKDRTAPLHAELDGRLACLGVGPPADYASFLAVQYAARAPIERWATSHCPIELRPPAVSSLIAADLSEMGGALPTECSFAMPPDGDVLGLAWALGGSALGNRAMLAERRCARGREFDQRAERFLSDRSMAQFFVSLLPRLELPSGTAEGAVVAAEAVFGTFLAAADKLVYEVAI